MSTKKYLVGSSNEKYSCDNTFEYKLISKINDYDFTYKLKFIYDNNISAKMESVNNDVVFTFKNDMNDHKKRVELDYCEMREMYILLHKYYKDEKTKLKYFKDE